MPGPPRAARRVQPRALMERADAVVVGAGLAGLACAFDLASAGRRVMLLEANPFLGGRTSSWLDGGMPVESGLHRHLGFYRALPRLWERAGLSIEDVIEWEYTIEIRSGDGTRGVFGVAPFYRPLLTFASLLGNNDLVSPLDKLSLLPASLLGLINYVFRPRWLDGRSIEDFARRRLVTARARENIITPLSTGLFFLPRDRYSAYAFFMPAALALRRVVRTRVGAFRGGMTEVMANPLGAAIERRGGVVRVDAPVARLRVDRGRVTGVEVSGERIDARHVVVATSLRPAQRLLQPFADRPEFAGLMALEAMPVITVQMELDQPALPVDRTTFGPGTSLASFAEQSRTTFPHAPGRLSIILSDPARFVGMPDDAILDVVIEDASRLGMQLDGHVLRHRVVRLLHDFYSLAPGNDALRPDQATPIQGLTLAGDYTRQPYLGTMEGAVVSGERAARAVLEAG